MSIITQHTLTKRYISFIEVFEEKDAETYDAIVAGDELLPAFSIVTLVDDSDVKTVKFVGSEAVSWANALPIGASTADVSNALKAKPQIASLNASSTAAQIVVALQS